MSFNQEKFDKLKALYVEWFSGGNEDLNTAHTVLESKLGERHFSATVNLPDFVRELPKEAHMSAFVLGAKASGIGVDIVGILNEFSMTTAEWFQVTDPAPTAQRLNAQFGVHVEECAEMFPEITSDNEELNAKMRLAKTLLDEIGAEFKTGRATLQVVNKGKFFDSLLDQRVTGTGVAHLCGFNIAEGVARVDFSNFTKFVDGVPVYKDGGKVAKGPYWTEADLTGLSGD